MNFPSIAKTFGNAFKAFGRRVKAHSPEICVGLGIAAGVGAIIFAITESPKAHRLIEEKKTELGVEKLPVKETVKTTWKCYAPVALLGITSAAFIISGSKISIGRTAAMGTLYTISRDAFEDYKASVKETTDEETQKKIDEKNAEKTVERVREKDPVIFVGEGHDNMIDSITKQPFTSSINAVDKLVNEFNRELKYCDEMTLNEWYGFLNLPQMPPSVGDKLGWHIEKTGYLEIGYDSIVDTVKGKAYIVLEYRTPPTWL